MTKKRSAVIHIALIFILILSLIFGFSAVGSLSARADKDEVSYKKQIVSVLFDNSGSMRNGNDNKTELARYSLELLAALLDSEDELYITPMNAQAVDYYEVNLALEDRYSEIQTKIVENSDFNGFGGTPPESVERALSVLTDRGLRSAGSSYDEARNVDYWLVMLTDGEFEGTMSTEAVIETNIKQYVGLNTIYLSFGSGSVDLTKKDLSLNKHYPFFPYCVPDATELVASMQDVANKISGRYGLESDLYSVSDNEISVDLDRFKFAVNNIAVIAQDCDAKLVGVECTGQNVSVLQKSVLAGSMKNSAGAAVQLVKDGYVAVVGDETYMSKGKVKFTFDKDVGENVSVLVEPAIYIDAYLERQGSNGWEKTDVQQINSEMRPGEEVRVQYKVFNSATDEELDLEEIFGAPTEKVTYCGKGYAVGEPIPLEKGSNAISVTITLLNDTYTMYSSIICYIEENPTYYRLEGDLSLDKASKEVTGVYRVYSGNLCVDRAGLSAYTVELQVTCPDGTVQSIPVGETDADGTIHFSYSAKSAGYGEFVFSAKVTDNTTRLTRSNTQTVAVVPEVLAVTCLTEGNFSTTEYLLGSNSSKKVEFSVTMDGVPTSFENGLLSYKLMLGNADLTEKCSVENGNLVFLISKDNLPDLTAGEKTLTLEANVLDGVYGSASYTFEIMLSSYRVEVLDGTSRELDIHDIEHTQAAVLFRIYKDNIPISSEEVTAAMESGEISVETNPFGWITLLPCKVDVSVEEQDDYPVIACRVGRSVGQPFDFWFSSFIFANEKEISLTYNGVSAGGTISIQTLSTGERVWRLATLLFTILFLLHVILFIIGFFVAKHLPCGTMLKCTVPSPENLNTRVGFSTQSVNTYKRDIILWHLSRFIPFREFANQRPKTVFKLQVQISKDRNPEFVFKSDYKVLEYDYRYNEKHESQKQVRDMIDGYANGKRSPKTPKIDRSRFEALLQRMGSVQDVGKGRPVNVKGAWCQVSAPAQKNSGTFGKKKEIYHFIELNRRKKRRR